MHAVTFKICVRKKRSDGLYVVYIRVIYKRKPDYIKTMYLASDADLSGSEVINYTIILPCDKIIEGYVERINKLRYSPTDVKELVEILEAGTEDVSFSDFCNNYIMKMELDGRTDAKNYRTSLNNLQKFIGRDNLMITHLNSKVLLKWIESLKGTARAKSLYPTCIKTMYGAALLEYNDYDENDIRIKRQPFARIKIPRIEMSDKRSVEKDILREIFEYVPEPGSRAEIARDVSLISFCLCGINTVDLYNLDKDSYYDGKIHYSRLKTKNKRLDDAYIEINVPEIIYPLFNKYQGEKDLLSFSDRYATSTYFNDCVNRGLKVIRSDLNISQNLDTYTFRHSWATIAQNDCGATTDDVAFGLNHQSAHRVTEGYIRKDFSRIDRLNEKVLEYVFGNDLNLK